MCEYNYTGGFQDGQVHFKENSGLWYDLQGDYCHTLPPEGEKPIVIWDSGTNAT